MPTPRTLLIHLIGCCGLLLLATFAGELRGQQTDELPEGALWRFGEVGEGLRPNGFYRLAYSPTGGLLAARTQQNEIVIIDVASHRQLCSVNNEDSTVLSVDFTPDEKYFLAAAPGEEVPLRIFNSQTGALVKEIGANIRHAFFSKDGKQIHALGASTVETYSWPDGERQSSHSWRKEAADPHALSRDGQLVVYSLRSINQGRRIQVYDIESKSTIFLRGPDKAVKAVAISPNQLWVAVIYHRDPQVQLWDLRDPHSVRYTLAEHRRTIQTINFSLDSRFLISTSWDQSAVVWDVPSKKMIGILKGHSDNVNSSAFAPLRWRVATGASGLKDNSVIVWDLKRFLFPELEETDEEPTFESVWLELGNEDPRRSLNATQTLINHQSDWTEQVAKIMGGISQSADVETVLHLIGQLADRKFSVREKATEQLIKLRGPAEIFLKGALEQEDLPPEARHRIAKILRQPGIRPKVPDDELRRIQRCILALELIESNQSIDVLRQLVSTRNNIDVSQSASSALERIRLRQSLGIRPLFGKKP